MAKRTLPGLGLTGYWTYGSDNWNVEMDANLRLLSALTQLNVESMTVAIADMVNTKMYIVPSTEATNQNAVAIYDNSVWVYIAPRVGMVASIAGGAQVRYNGTAWVVNVASPVWGTFTGTLADQADLQAALALRLPKTGGTLSGQLNHAPLVTLASAATVAIGAADANTINITGTTGITAFDVIADGAERTLVFSGVVTLTHDPAKLLLPKGVNLTTAAGDVVKFTSLGGGLWKCTGKMLAADGGGGGSAGGLSVGFKVAWPLSEASIPGGMLPENGQIVNRATWPDLWTLVSTQAISDATWLADPLQRGKFSTGNGTTTFRMPDTNGKWSDGLTPAAAVLRGHGKNSAGTPGLFQLDQIQNIVGETGLAPTAGLIAGATVPTGAFTKGAANSLWASAGNASSSNNLKFDASLVARTGTETRGTNVTVIWCTVGASGVSNPGTVDVTALATDVASNTAKIASIEAKQVFTKEYVSAEQTMSVAGTLTLAHGLGAKPKVVRAYMVCKVASGNWAVGDEIIFDLDFENNNSAAVIFGWTCKRDATSLIIRFAASGMFITDAVTGTYVPTATVIANFKIVFEAWV